MTCTAALGLIGSAAYCLRFAEKVEWISLGRWSLTVQSSALGSSLITSTIGTFNGLQRLERNVEEVKAARSQCIKTKLEVEQSLILMKLAADVAVCAWAIFELVNLLSAAVISPSVLSASLAVCCGLLLISGGYEYYLSGGWDKLQAKVGQLLKWVK